MHPLEQLAPALGWTLERLSEVAINVDKRIRLSGLGIHQNTNVLTIRPADDSSSKALKILTELRDDDQGILQTGLPRLWLTSDL